MSFSKKNLIIIGVAILLLVLTIVLTSGGSKKTNKIATTPVNNKDFDTKKEEPTPTLTPTPTLKPTLTPTPKPTTTPVPTNTPAPTATPTLKPTPRKRPTPTIDTNIYATGIVLDVTELDLEIDESYQIGYRIEPDDTTDETVYWSSDNGDIVLVTGDGWVVGKSVGEVNVVARTSNGKTNSVRVRVRQPEPIATATPTAVPYPTRIDLSLSRLILKVGEMKNLYVKYQPENIVNKTVTWTTSDSNIVTVSSSGVVKGIKLGTATIKVISVNNLSEEATVVVSAN